MVEIIPKPSTKHPFWFNFLFYCSIAFVLLSGLAFLWLNWSYQKAMQIKTELEQALLQERKGFEALEKEVLTYERKLNDFSLLLSDHKKPLNFFPILEKLTHPEVQFSQLNLNLKDNKAALSGRAKSFVALDQQLFILKKAPGLKDVELSTLSLEGEGGGVSFSLMLSLDPAIFRP